MVYVVVNGICCFSGKNAYSTPCFSLIFATNRGCCIPFLVGKVKFYRTQYYAAYCLFFNKVLNKVGMRMRIITSAIADSNTEIHVAFS